MHCPRTDTNLRKKTFLNGYLCVERAGLKSDLIGLVSRAHDGNINDLPMTVTSDLAIPSILVQFRTPQRCILTGCAQISILSTALAQLLEPTADRA